MKVFVVHEEVDDCGGYVLGVYLTYAKAMERAQTRMVEHPWPGPWVEDEENPDSWENKEYYITVREWNAE